MIKSKNSLFALAFHIKKNNWEDVTKSQPIQDYLKSLQRIMNGSDTPFAAEKNLKVLVLNQVNIHHIHLEKGVQDMRLKKEHLFQPYSTHKDGNLLFF